MRNIDISRMLGIEWKDLSAEDKKPFIDKEQIERKLYYQRMSEWKDDKEQKVVEVKKENEVALPPLTKKLQAMEKVLKPYPQLSIPRSIQAERGNRNTTFFDINIGDHFVGQDMMIDDLYSSLEESPCMPPSSFLPTEGNVDIDEWWREADALQDNSMEPLTYFPDQERSRLCEQQQGMVQEQTLPYDRPSLVRRVSDVSTTVLPQHSDTVRRQFFPNLFREVPSSQSDILTIAPILSPDVHVSASDVPCHNPPPAPVSSPIVVHANCVAQDTCLSPIECRMGDHETTPHVPAVVTPTPFHRNFLMSSCNNFSTNEYLSHYFSNEMSLVTAPNSVDGCDGTKVNCADFLEKFKPIDDCTTTGYDLDSYFNTEE